LDCILKTQIRVNGKPTVWCAQHDEFTLAPVAARTYELASLSGAESVGVVSLLMDIEQPTPEVINAVQGAVKWFESAKIQGFRYQNRTLSKDPSAAPIWARFYELETSRPFFCDRDGIKKYDLSEIGEERRKGYAWYTTAPAAMLKKYPAWAARVGK
jgi:PelA/Pel-15E family pectate lyase